MQLLLLAGGFVLLAGVFCVLESLWPSIPAQPRWRRGVATDVIYWFFTPVVARSVNLLLVLAAIAPLLLILGYEPGQEELRAAVRSGHGPVRSWPAWVQVLIVFVIGDFVGYWSHRWFHGRWLWRIHAVHHSSKEMDWLSSVRQHPLNDFGTRLCQTVPFVMAGFSPAVVAAFLPLLTLHAVFVHANVPWAFGPFRYVLSSPAFHRWHHSKDEAAIDKNFAGFLPLWDLIFGTFHMPPGRQPEAFGVHDDSVPEGFAEQLAYPFRPSRQRHPVSR